MEIIQRTVLKGTHLPIEIKEIQAGYLHNPYFKEIYQYLSQNKLLHSKMAIKKIEAVSKKYILLDSLLFRIYPDRGDISSGNTRIMHRQDNNIVLQKPICRPLRGN